LGARDFDEAYQLLENGEIESAIRLCHPVAGIEQTAAQAKVVI